MRVLKQKARQFGEDRSLDMAEVSLFLEKLEYRIDVAFNMIDIFQKMEDVSDKDKKVKIAYEVQSVVDFAKSMSLKGKMALPLQFRRVIDKWNRLVSLAEEILIGEEKL